MAQTRDEIYVVIGRSQIELYDIDGEVRLINGDELRRFLAGPPAEVVMAVVSDINDKRRVQVLSRQQLKGFKDQPGILEVLERQYLLYSVPEELMRGLPPLSVNFLPAPLALKIFLEHEGLLKNTVLVIERVEQELRFFVFTGGVARYSRIITLYSRDDLELEVRNTYLYLRDNLLEKGIDLVVSNLDFLDNFYPLPSLTVRGLELRRGKLKHIATLESLKKKAQTKESRPESRTRIAVFIAAALFIGWALGLANGAIYLNRTGKDELISRLRMRNTELDREVAILTKGAAHEIDKRLGGVIFGRKPRLGPAISSVLSSFPRGTRLVQLHYAEQRLSLLGETDKASEIPEVLRDISRRLPGSGSIVYEGGKAYLLWEIPLGRTPATDNQGAKRAGAGKNGL